MSLETDMTAPTDAPQYFNCSNAGLTLVFRRRSTSGQMLYERYDPISRSWLADKSLAELGLPGNAALTSESEAMALAHRSADAYWSAPGSTPRPDFFRRYYGAVTPTTHRLFRAARLLFWPIFDAWEHVRFDRPIHGALRPVAMQSPEELRSPDESLEDGLRFGVLRCKDCAGPVTFRRRASKPRRVVATILLATALFAVVGVGIWAELLPVHRRERYGIDRLGELGLTVEQATISKIRSAQHADWYTALGATTPEQRAVIDRYVYSPTQVGNDVDAEWSASVREFQRPEDKVIPLRVMVWAIIASLVAVRLGRPRAGLECAGCRRYLIV